MPVVGDVSNTAGSVASIPGKVVGTGGDVLSRDVPVVGDVSNTVGGVASIPGKAVGNAGDVLSRDLPGVSDAVDAVKPVEGVVGDVPGSVIPRQTFGGGYGAVPAGGDDASGSHYPRDLPGVSDVADVVKPVEGVVGNVPGTVIPRQTFGGGYGAVPAGGDDASGSHYPRELPNIPAIPVVPQVVDTVAPVEAVPGNVLSGVLSA